jgi:hypothetical protein
MASSAPYENEVQREARLAAALDREDEIRLMSEMRGLVADQEKTRFDHDYKEFLPVWRGSGKAQDRSDWAQQVHTVRC